MLECGVSGVNGGHFASRIMTTKDLLNKNKQPIEKTVERWRIALVFLYLNLYLMPSTRQLGIKANSIGPSRKNLKAFTSIYTQPSVDRQMVLLMGRTGWMQRSPINSSSKAPDRV